MLTYYSSKRLMLETNIDGNVCYIDAEDGWTMKRETLSKNGETYTDVWVLRTKLSEVVDFDQYRFDLEARHNLSLVLKIG